MNGGEGGLKVVLPDGKRKLPKMGAGLESMINEVSDRIKPRVHSPIPNTGSTFRFQPYYSHPESGVQEREHCLLPQIRAFKGECQYISLLE